MDRNIAPQLTDICSPNLLAYQTIKLSNGIEIIYLNDPDQEVFKMDVVFDSGSYYQPAPLVASTMLSMINEGTSEFTSTEIAEYFDFHGAYVGFSSGFHKSEISLISLTRYAPETIKMISEMITGSIFPKKEMEILVRNKRQQHLINEEKTSYLARKEFSLLFFGKNHPYSNYFELSDFDNLNPTILKNFYNARISANGCKIILCGNVNDIILKTVEKYFSNLESKPLTEEPIYYFESSSPGTYKVLKDDAVQTSVRIGKKGVHILDEDYTHFQILNMVLGGYFGSRLMSNIREEKGLTYGISSFNVSMLHSSYWNVATDVNSDKAELTIEECTKEIRKLQNEPVPEEELNLVKSYFNGELLRELDGVFSQADALKHKMNYNLDNSFYLKVIEEIKKCNPQNLRDLANKYLNIDEMYFITCGK